MSSVTTFRIGVAPRPSSWMKLAALLCTGLFLAARYSPTSGDTLVQCVYSSRNSIAAAGERVDMNTMYGFEICPWMKEAKAVRYPRVHTRPIGKNSSTYKCMAALAADQLRGDLVFVPFGGIGLTGMTTGGFHGYGDDSDIDIKSASRVHKNINNHCCGENIGVYGFEFWPKTKGASDEQSRSEIAAMTGDKSSAGYQALPAVLQDSYFQKACACEWEGLPVLCLSDEDYWVYEYGRSYWVPPAASGGKDTGKNFKFFMDPDGNYGTSAVMLAGLARTIYLCVIT